MAIAPVTETPHAPLSQTWSPSDSRGAAVLTPVGPRRVVEESAPVEVAPCDPLELPPKMRL